MREDIIRMARESNLGFLFEDHLLVHDELERFAALVRAAEREACAKVCEKQDGEHDHIYAAAIRARGQT
jgi:hypothetical protein